MQESREFAAVRIPAPWETLCAVLRASIAFLNWDSIVLRSVNFVFSVAGRRATSNGYWLTLRQMCQPAETTEASLLPQEVVTSGEPILPWMMVRPLPSTQERLNSR